MSGSSPQWYYARDSVPRGPVSTQQLQALVEQGQVTVETQVWKEGMAGWERYSQVVRKGEPSIHPPPDLAASVPTSPGFAPVATSLPWGGRSAEQVRKEYLSHEASTQSVGLLYLLGGGILGLTGSGVLVSGLIVQVGGQSKGMDLAAGAFFGLFLLAWSGVQIWLGLGLRRLRRNVRIGVTLFSVLGLLGFPLGTLINGYILYLLHSGKGKVVFSEPYRQVIAATPQIRYRTSPIAWLALAALVLVVIALAGYAVFRASRAGG
jgi:GYF domain 2